MMIRQSASSEPRRSFLTRFQAGAAAVAALAAGRVARAQVKSAPARFEPERYSQDDWMDQIPGKHRMVFDSFTADGFNDAVLWAGNFLLANRNDYGLKNEDMAVIIVARHFSTGYGYKDEMWAKYGATLAGPGSPADGRVKEAPKANPSASAVAALVSQGVHFAVCQMATRRLAGMIARGSGGTADAIFTELGANLVTNARLVPAGIVAVNRAQERGYTLVSA